MINFFDKLYSSIISKNALGNKILLYSCIRFMVRTIANIVLPVYLKLTSNNPDYVLKPTEKTTGRLIVSLTSFPARISKVWLAIETILRQTKKPDMIILWLYEEQFLGLESLPQRLLEMQKRGLIIKFRPVNLRSHTKYYFALTEYPSDIIVTIDDDIFYNTTLIEVLLKGYSLYPNNTIATCCKQLLLNSNNEIIKYNVWKVIKHHSTNLYTFGLGVGGVLYPPGVLSPLFKNVDVFTKICFYADDVWLYFMTIINGNRCVKIDFPSKIYLPVMIRNSMPLSSYNVNNSENDIQIKAVFEYSTKKLGKNPFNIT